MRFLRRSVIVLMICWMHDLAQTEVFCRLLADEIPRSLLRGSIIDSDTNQPIAARISIQSSNGDFYFPKSASKEGSAVEYRRRVGPKSFEQHVTLSAHPFEVELPPGKYDVHLERGKEYRSVTMPVQIEGPRADLVFGLKRWVNMASQGWYSGDVHLHRPLAEVPNLVLAEDLNVAFPLSNWVTAAETSPVAGNQIEGPAPAAKWIAVDATHGIYPRNTEYEIFTVANKPHTLGAVLLLGQTQLLEQGVPPVRRIAELAHRDGAFLDLEKHSWAWTPMIVPLMKPELFELVNNHCWPTDFAFHTWTLENAPKSMQLDMNSQGFTEWGWIEFGLKSYYAYLNCGFRLFPSAGTGSGVHPVPAGFGRVYVHLPGEFSYEAWRDGLLQGHSFVTTGPMLQIQFNDKPAGSSFAGSPAGTLIHVEGSASSVAVLDRVEILVNGVVVKSIANPPDAPQGAMSQLHVNEKIRVKGTGWVVVRCFERHPDHRMRFAHTAPVFVEQPGISQTVYKDEVDHFVERMQHEIKRHENVLRPDAVDEYREALSIYEGLRSHAIDRPKR